MRLCVSGHMNPPWLDIALQCLQTGLHQIQGLEEQGRAGATQRATHEGFQRRVSLRDTKRENI